MKTKDGKRSKGSVNSALRTLIFFRQKRIYKKEVRNSINEGVGSPGLELQKKRSENHFGGGAKEAMKRLRAIRERRRRGRVIPGDNNEEKRYTCRQRRAFYRSGLRRPTIIKTMQSTLPQPTLSPRKLTCSKGRKKKVEKTKISQKKKGST